jgi:hypothetical protein
MPWSSKWSLSFWYNAALIQGQLFQVPVGEQLSEHVFVASLIFANKIPVQNAK